MRLARSGSAPARPLHPAVFEALIGPFAVNLFQSDGFEARNSSFHVIPAKAGTQSRQIKPRSDVFFKVWVPASAKPSLS